MNILFCVHPSRAPGSVYFTNLRRDTIMYGKKHSGAMGKYKAMMGAYGAFMQSLNRELNNANDPRRDAVGPD